MQKFINLIVKLLTKHLEKKAISGVPDVDIQQSLHNAEYMDKKKPYNSGIVGLNGKSWSQMKWDGVENSVSGKCNSWKGVKFTKPLRKVDRVFLHCSDSDAKSFDDVEAIRNDHINNNGWKDIGYHFVITQDGTIWEGRNIEQIPAAQKGHNIRSIAICLTGKKVFSEEQFKSLQKLCNKINKQYEGDIEFWGHREVASDRTCPVFDYKEVLGLENRKIALL